MVFAPNLDLCRLHVAPFNSTGLTSLKSTGTCPFFVFTYPVDLCVFCRHIFCYIFVTSSLEQLVYSKQNFVYCIQGWVQIRFSKYKYKYKYASSDFFKYKIQIQIRLAEIFQIQIQIQIRLAEIFQIQIQIQIRLPKIFQIQIQIQIRSIKYRVGFLNKSINTFKLIYWIKGIRFQFKGMKPINYVIETNLSETVESKNNDHVNKQNISAS